MCGRFETVLSVQSLFALFKENDVDLQVSVTDRAEKTENIAPAEKIFSINYSNRNYILSRTNWGIKFSEDSPLIFNSRIETIKTKNFWGNIFDKNRALVPMTGFYEWKKEKAKKIPFRIFLPDEKIFFVPALFYTDKNKHTYTSLITTTPNDFIRQVHHRMPVILSIKQGISYLAAEKEKILNMCVPYVGEMRMEKADI